MSNFGIQCLRVVNPFEPSFREARSAVGPASEILAKAEAFTSIPDAIADCGLVVGTTAIQHRELMHPLHRLDEAAQRIREHLSTTNVAIVFGSEKTGLSNDDLSYCHWLLHIPARHEHRSMNLGHAVAVTLYEVANELETIPVTEQPAAASSAELERVTSTLVTAMTLSGYVAPGSLGATEEKARRMVRRLNLDARDAETLLGMFRQIIWKLKRDTDPQS